jgi:hypothetical protein
MIERILTVITLVGTGIVIGAWTVIYMVHKEPPPVQPQPGYVIRRGEFTIIDKRKFPDRSINPSWMEPNMRYTCTETR